MIVSVLKLRRSLLEIVGLSVSDDDELVTGVTCSSFVLKISDVVEGATKELIASIGSKNEII